jgi:hypothetical protein
MVVCISHTFSSRLLDLVKSLTAELMRRPRSWRTMVKVNEYQTGSWTMGDVFTAKVQMGVEGGKGPKCGVPIGERVALTA